MYKFLLANRYLRTRFIALASIVSVTLGVATMIVVNSVMTGFSCQMRERIHATLSDVMVETTSMNGTADPAQLIQQVEDLAGDYILAVTPTVEVYGMMCFNWMGQDIYRTVTLVGIVPETKNQVSPLAQYLVSRQEVVEDGVRLRGPLREIDAPLDWSLTEEALRGRADWLPLREELSSDFASPEDAAPPVVSLTDDPFSQQAAQAIDPSLPQPCRLYVGAGLISFPWKDHKSDKTRIMHMARPGQDVIITTIKTGKPDPASFRATIVDVFKSGMSEYDSTLVFCNLEELQLARGMLASPDPNHPHEGLDWRRGAVTTLQIKLKDYADAPEVVRRLRAGIDDIHLQVRTWEEKQGPLLEAVQVESAILNVLLFLIITVAGFGILAIFYMIVVEKTRDIGILKALGASSRGVMTIFLFYGLSLGLVGSGAGVAIGLLFVHYINQIEQGLSWVTGRKIFDEAIYYFHDIPTVIHPSMVMSVALGAMVIAVLASVLPARRAARLHPVRALRYE